MTRSALCLFDEGMEASAVLYCQLYEGLPQFPGSNHVSLTSFDGTIAPVLRLKHHICSFSLHVKAEACSLPHVLAPSFLALHGLQHSHAPIPSSHIMQDSSV